MEAAAALPQVRINRFLPYVAVFQSDLKQTLRSWIYRLWVLLTMSATVGYLLYRFGAKQVGAFVQPAPEVVSDLMTWVVWGSITLIIVITSGAICGERGTMADSVLCRGISRTQYFLGKLHSRLVIVLGTFLLMSTVALAGSMFLLHSERLSLTGALLAIATVASILTMIVSIGVSVSAIANTTVVSITVVWMTLYGLGFLMSFLPADYPSPDRALQNLPNVLKGMYDLHSLTRLLAGTMAISLFMSLVGLVCFSRKDV
ncbi:MAG: ABC transporter permease subunit [Gemmataceae bacterium]